MFGGRQKKILHKLELKLKKAGHNVGTGSCSNSDFFFACADCGYSFTFKRNAYYPNLIVLNQPMWFYMQGTKGHITELLTCKETQNNDERLIPNRTVARNNTNIKLRKFHKKLRRFGHKVDGNVCTICKASFGIDPCQTRLHNSSYLVDRIMRCEEVKTVEMIRDIIE